MNNIRDSHCSWCGSAFTDLQQWPRTCNNCREITYRNPIPVVVTLLPVGNGLVVIRRSIEPGYGQLALPGGFIDYGETWQEAGAREVWEETEIRIQPDSIKLFHLRNLESLGLILIFGVADSLEAGALPEFRGTEETSERIIAYEPLELAWPHHTNAMREWFAGSR